MTPSSSEEVSLDILSLIFKVSLLTYMKYKLPSGFIHVIHTDGEILFEDKIV